MLSSPVAVILPWTTLINFVSQTKVREGGKVAQRNIAKLDLKKTPATRFLEFCLLRFFSCYIIFSSSFFYPLGVQTASVKISLTWDENLWRNHIPKLTTFGTFFNFSIVHCMDRKGIWQTLMKRKGNRQNPH